MPHATKITLPHQRGGCLHHAEERFHSLQYLDTAPALHPMGAPSPPYSSTRSTTNGAVKHKIFPDSRSFFKRRSHPSEDVRRDSGLAPSLFTIGTDTHSDKNGTTSGSDVIPVIPSIIVQDESDYPSSRIPWTAKRPNSTKSYTETPTQPESPQPPPTQDGNFHGITTDIPTGEFTDLFSSTSMQFSNRGSVLWRGEKANAVLENRRTTSTRSMLDGTDERDSHILTPEEKRLSQRVRSMYEPIEVEHGGLEEQSRPFVTDESRNLSDNDTLTDLPKITLSPRLAPLRDESATCSRTPSAMSSRRISLIKKEPYEAAGGIEDWRDVEGGDVDRYGFIKPRDKRSLLASTSLPGSPVAPRSPHSGSALTTADAAPPQSRNLNRAHHGLAKHRLSTANSSIGPSPSLMSTRSKRSSVSSAYKSPKWIVEASTMLSPPPGFSSLNRQPNGFDDEPSSAKAALERKREVKWQKMARPIKSGSGGGTIYTFDTSNTKLISRAWKGIPDRWRATAWHSFLSTSASRQRNLPSDATLISAFHRLQFLDCPDDVQIDMDVPRTIGEHIMFRRRYRGGQRLLFRVLRALALHFPGTGYVQGMAPLAATLLCYYDEEMAFVMSVRLWMLRGIGELYRPGFEGLMGALEVFEKTWIGGRAVGEQLDALGIASTAYGTKWYLTLFNYSIPFQAQLRVWDVFMLLGDGDGAGGAGSGDLDVLHATSAALLDGLQEMLLDSDFETAMKMLTSAVPLGREDVLMQVAKKEWKERRRRT